MQQEVIKKLEEYIKKNKTTETPVDYETYLNNVDFIKENEENWQEKYNELNDKYLRTLAEYDNFRKRTLKEKEELKQNGQENFIKKILPLIDDFERALINISDDGVNLIYNKFLNTLYNFGVSEINVEKNKSIFNTDLHEAIQIVNVNNKKQHNKIIEIIQKGYKLNDKIMRFPKVIVGNFNEI